ncbi:MAG: AbrB/MazE/SpoVT family DNA-binding domain-containing protein [Candidatus Woesearchaeota archaeon]
MKRKLVKQGAATLMVSLPSKWAKKFNLKKGDEVEVEERGMHVVLKPKTAKKEAVISCFEAGGMVNDYISALYEAGNEEVFVETKRIKDTNIEINPKNLEGFEIVKQTEEGIIFKQIVEGENIESLYDKVFSMAVMFAEDCVSLVKGSKINYVIVTKRKDSIINYCNFCKRAAIKKSERNEKAVQLYCIALDIEKIITDFFSIIELAVKEDYLGDNKDNKNNTYSFENSFAGDNLISVMTTGTTLFNNLYHLYKRFDLVVAASFYEKLDEVTKKIHNISIQTQKQLLLKERICSIFSLLSDILKKILMTANYHN